MDKTDFDWTVKAVDILCPNADFNVLQPPDGAISIRWNDLKGDTKPDQSTIDTKIAELKTAYNNNEYQRKRHVAYPNIREQLDLLYWDQVNGTSKFKEAIAKVKADNPKP